MKVLLPTPRPKGKASGSLFMAVSDRLMALPPAVRNLPVEPAFHAVLADLTEASVRFQDDAKGLYDVQLAVKELLLANEADIAVHKKAGGAPSHAPGGAFGKPPTPASAAAVGWSIATRRTRGLRDLGDGIAWRLLRCDRPWLTAFANRASHHRLTATSIDSEFSALHQIIDGGGGPGVITDLTHFLRCSDVLVRTGPKSYGLYEVKSGDGDGRAQHQKRHAERQSTQAAKAKVDAWMQFVISDNAAA